MKTVIIARGFAVDAPKPATYAEGEEATVADATADQWLAKGLARLKPGPKPEPAKPADPKPAQKSAD